MNDFDKTPLEGKYVISPPPSPSQAYYNQRHSLARNSDQLRRIRQIINDPVNLSSFQWAQWFTYALEYKPSLILELGRGRGNSTAVFCQAVQQYRNGRIVSLCLTDLWQQAVVPLLEPAVGPDWLAPLDARIGDMLNEDFPAIIGDARRVLVLWDAHGFEIAELVLGHILPLLADREHVIIMHDISDLRYARKSLEYNGAELWKGQNWVYGDKGRHESRLYLGWIDTIVDQAIAVVDFMTRNHGELLAADDSFHREIGQNEERLQEMEQTLSKDDWSLSAHWAYFSLNTLSRPYTFPRFVSPPKPEPPPSPQPELSPPPQATARRVVEDTRTIDLLTEILRRVRLKMNLR